jgi:hypothetical protein
VSFQTTKGGIAHPGNVSVLQILFS